MTIDVCETRITPASDSRPKQGPLYCVVLTSVIFVDQAQDQDKTKSVRRRAVLYRAISAVTARIGLRIRRSHVRIMLGALHTQVSVPSRRRCLDDEACRSRIAWA